MRLDRLPAFVRGNTFRVVVESPRGSTVKLKFDSSMQAMTVSRPLTLGVAYPFDWGFVPGTEMPDGDPVDAMIVWDTPTFPGVVAPCRALGLVRVSQRKASGRGRESNDRILAIPLKAPRASHLRTPADLPSRTRKELEQFFFHVTALEKKDIRILGWSGPDAAIRLIRRLHPTPRLTPIYFCLTSSTRRFACRPSAVVFGTAGFVAPKPRDVKRPTPTL